MIEWVKKTFHPRPTDTEREGSGQLLTRVTPEAEESVRSDGRT
jgi:hypothetical protein